MVKNVKKIYTSYFGWHLFLTLLVSRAWVVLGIFLHRFSKTKVYSIENL